MELHKFDLKVKVDDIIARQEIIIVVEKGGMNTNGIPTYLLKLYMYNSNDGYGHEWEPPLKGFRRRKDGKYRVAGHQRSLKHLAQDFKDTLQEYIDNGYS